MVLVAIQPIGFATLMGPPGFLLTTIAWLSLQLNAAAPQSTRAAKFKTNTGFACGIFAACVVADWITTTLRVAGMRVFIRRLNIARRLLLSLIVGPWM